MTNTPPAPSQETAHEFPAPFTPEEDARLRAEIEALTPEMWLYLNNQLENLEKQVAKNVTDYPVVALIDLETRAGDRVALTLRGFSPVGVLDSVADTLRYAKSRYSLLQPQKRRAQASPAPVQAVGAPLPPPPAPRAAVVPMPPMPPASPPQAEYVPVTSSADPGGPRDERGNTPGQTLIETLAYIEITPVVGGNPKVALYPYMPGGRPGQYPKSTEQVRTPAEWVQLFANRPVIHNGAYVYLTEAHFQGAAKYELPKDGAAAIQAEFMVSTKRAKNGTGNYYINLNRIMPPM